MEHEMGRKIRAAGVVLRLLSHTVVMKRELSQKAIFVPTLTYGHEGWVMTERTQIQAAERDSLRRVAGISLQDRVRSLAIREGLGVEPLLLCVERSQLRWFRHLARMPPGHLPREVFQAHPADVLSCCDVIPGPCFVIPLVSFRPCLSPSFFMYLSSCIWILFSFTEPPQTVYQKEFMMCKGRSH